MTGEPIVTDVLFAEWMAAASARTLEGMQQQRRRHRLAILLGHVAQLGRDWLVEAPVRHRGLSRVVSGVQEIAAAVPFGWVKRYEHRMDAVCLSPAWLAWTLEAPWNFYRLAYNLGFFTVGEGMHYRTGRWTFRFWRHNRYARRRAYRARAGNVLTMAMLKKVRSKLLDGR